MTDSASNTPARRPNADYRWTLPKALLFLEALAECGKVAEAARRVGMSPQSAFRLRGRLAGTSLERGWDLALGRERGRMQIRDFLTFNALDLFTVPHDHGVGMVAPFAGGRPLAITGWLRTGDPSGPFGRARHMTARFGLAAAALLAALAPVGAAAQEVLTVAEARASLLGHWEGKFELLDEGTSESFEWPVAVSIEDAGDGATYIERQQFAGMDDDGALQVRVTLLGADGVTEHATLFTRGTVPEHRTMTLTLTAGADASHWTLRGVENYERDGEALQARYAVTRDGDTLVATFEVDPAGEEPPFGMTRRTLRRVAAVP